MCHLVNSRREITFWKPSRGTPYHTRAVRILFLDQFSDPGGAQQVLMELLPAIRRRGWEAAVGLPGNGGLFGRIRELGFAAEPVACGPFHSGRKTAGDLARLIAQLPRLARQIRRLSGEFEPDVIYINGPRLLPAAAMAAPRAPVLFHAHSYLFPGASRRLAGVALRRLQARIAGSCRFVADVWRAWVPPARISVIYNGIAGGVTDVLRSPSSPCVIGCVGRISPEKGQREFIAAALLIHRAIPDARFVVYGAPLFGDEDAARYYDEVRAAAAGLPVEFAGWISDVQAALSGLDLLLVPSAPHEATPRVILEAFAAGVPVIAFPSGGIPELIDNNRTGFLAGSVEEMAGLAIELLAKDRSRLAAAAQAAGSEGRSRFSAERFQRDVLTLIETAAGDVNGASVTNENRIRPSECPYV